MLRCTERLKTYTKDDECSNIQSLYIVKNKMLVVQNAFRSESVLRKKSNSVCYYTVHLSVAIGKLLVECIPRNEKVTDLMTKAFYGQRIFFILWMTNISSVIINHNDKLDLIGNCIKLEGTRKMLLWLGLYLDIKSRRK